VTGTVRAGTDIDGVTEVDVDPRADAGATRS
jgi:hypothetical protein